MLNQCAPRNHAAKHRNAVPRQVSVCCGAGVGGCQYHPSWATTGLMRVNAWLLLQGVGWASVGEARRPHGTRVLPNTPRFSHELQVVCLATFWASTFQGGHWGRYGVNIHPSWEIPPCPSWTSYPLLTNLSLAGMQQISEQDKYQKSKTFSKFQILEYLEADAMMSGISFKILQGKKGEWEQMRTDEIRMVKCQNMLKLCDGYMRAHQIILYFVCMFPNVHNKGNK